MQETCSIVHEDMLNYPVRKSMRIPNSQEPIRKLLKLACVKPLIVDGLEFPVRD